MDYVLTNDYYMRYPGITTPDDDHLLSQVKRAVSVVEFLELVQELPEEEREALPPEPTPGFYKLDPERFKAMTKAAARTSTEFTVLAKTLMTTERAEEVRELRCQKKHSWRAVALACHERWGGSWTPPSNQIMGIEICAAACDLLGENPQELPWNDL